MEQDPESARRKDPQTDTTLSQWRPPASALRAAAKVAAPSQTANLAQSDVLAHAQTESARRVAGSGPDVLSVGAIVGERYVIEQPISAGGFGAVYRASDRQITNHRVALKLLHLPAASEEARSTALRELTLIASVSHPSVVQFKDYGWHEGRLWFAMPLYRGETLDKCYAGPDGPLAIGRTVARQLFERLAQGLAAMHDVAIYHHDVKPENIFVADVAGFTGGLPVLLDLGIASKRGEGPKGLTIEYAAPETAATALGTPGKTIGAAADVFSLALVLRNLLEPETASPRSADTMVMLHQRATEPMAPFRQRELCYLIPAFARWLSLDPAERPSAAELAAELSILTQPEERREARARVRRRVVPVVLAAALIVSLLLLQVRNQKTVITVQKRELSAQVEQSAALRRRSTDQLVEIESASQKLGAQGQRLRQVIAIARQLDDQLKIAEERIDGLTQGLRKLSVERDTLTAERTGLLVERERVVAERDALTRERDGLTTERGGLLGERDALRNERDRVAAERARLETERDAVLTQRDDAIRARDALQSEQEKLQQLVQAESAELSALKKANDVLRQAATKQPAAALEPWK